MITFVSVENRTQLLLAFVSVECECGVDGELVVGVYDELKLKL